MPVIFDTDPRGNSNTRLFVFGLTALVVVALLLVALYAKMNGTFDKTVTATAVLADVGDGLPSNSDVKYRGVLVGTVKGVDPGTDGGLNYVDLALDPSYTRNIPRTVTARVVPSNVFAVSSIQLVDNGSAPGLNSGADHRPGRESVDGAAADGHDQGAGDHRCVRSGGDGRDRRDARGGGRGHRPPW